LFAHTADTGIKHGTVTVLIKRRPYEVTTYRLDGAYLDRRRPSGVTFTEDIARDLARRDFTMNAIAYNPKEGFTDPFAGQRDIKDGIIRAVGNAVKRFDEDALRMLRAVRFSAQLCFNIEGGTLSAITGAAETLSHISAERIRDELIKLLTGKNPGAAMLLSDTGLMRPALIGRDYGGDLRGALGHIKQAPKDVPAVFALFLRWAGDESKTIMRQLRFDNKTIRETVSYIQALPSDIGSDAYGLKVWLRRFPPERFRDLTALKEIVEPNRAAHWKALREAAERIVKSGEPYLLKHLAVDGGTLAGVGIPRGKAMGEVLSALLDAVTRDPSLNRTDALTGLAANIIQKADSYV
jgi:tRNA nucleotidyltransferase (CCA-adding enzyme)